MILESIVEEKMRKVGEKIRMHVKRMKEMSKRNKDQSSIHDFRGMCIQFMLCVLCVIGIDQIIVYRSLVLINVFVPEIKVHQTFDNVVHIM